MKISEAFPSSYLKSSDLGGGTAKAIIAECRLEDLGDETKPVLHFQGKDRGLVLNKTNAAVLVDAYGDETSDWVGRPVEIYAAKVQFQGRLVDGLRVRIPAAAAAAPAATPAPAAQPATPAPAAEPFNDDIPW